MKKLDALGDRMKGYESVFKQKLLRRSYTMMRIDGKAFHTYTKGLNRPFDWDLVHDMDDTAKYLCENIQGAKCAFVQSDEITIAITDFDNINTSAWFDNSLQKMVSVSASMATSKFNNLRAIRRWEEVAWDNEKDCMTQVDSLLTNRLAEFDSRVWQVPTRGEAINNFIWRQQDCVKNSISTVAQSKFSTKELHGKNGADKQEMLFQEHGINWNDFNPKLKRGRIIIKETYEKTPEVFRTRWVSVAPPTFTQDREYLENLIPDNN
jgi:tRNA(His) guanylyltransferase